MKIQMPIFLITCLALSACERGSGKLVLSPETIFEETGQHVISSGFNKKLKTVFTLYGNPAAVQSALDSSDEHYPGEIFKLVTWHMKENAFWFGGNINGEKKSVETVSVLGTGKDDIRFVYEIQEKGKKMASGSADNKERIDFIFAMKASVFP